jgi:hypothetical protein
MLLLVLLIHGQRQIVGIAIFALLVWMHEFTLEISEEWGMGVEGLTDWEIFYSALAHLELIRKVNLRDLKPQMNADKRR